MNDKYIAEQLAIIQAKVDWIIGQMKLPNRDIRLPDTCPACNLTIKYVIATDGAPVRKCGCSTGIKSVDMNSYSNPSAK